VKRSVGDAAREWDPDARWLHPFAAVLWLYAVLGLAHWTHLNMWLMILPGTATTVAAVLTVRKFYNEIEYGAQHTKEATWFMWGAGLVTTAWMVYAASRPPESRWLLVHINALGLLVVGGAALGAFYGMITTKAPGRKADISEAKAEDLALHSASQLAAYQEKIASEYAPLMDRGGVPGMKVIDKKETDAGFRLTILDNPDTPYKFGKLQDACGSIASILAHEYALQGIALAAHHVRAEESGAAHMFYLHVSTKNVFGQDLPYRFDQPISSFLKPIVPGVYEDGKPVELTLYGKTVVHVATTGGGKTVWANNIIAGVGRTNNAVPWFGATSKLTPLSIPWLAPWLLGHTDEPVVDAIAGQNAQRVTDLLAEFYHVVCIHNEQIGATGQRIATPDDPSVMFFLEEASALLEDYSSIKSRTFDGHDWNASQIINACARELRAAGDGLYLLTQFGLMDALGTHGSKVKRNITVRIAGRTETAFDGTSTLVRMDHVDTTQLSNNEQLVQPSVETPRAIPAKAFHLDGDELIAPVATRNTRNKPRLPEYVTSQLGDAYHRRWSPEYLPELARAAHVTYGVTWPAPPSLPPGESVTVEVAGTVPEQPQRGDTGDTGQVRLTAEELLDQGAAQMAHARDQIRKYGTLGETMTAVFGKIRAENAPDFVPCPLLARVIERDDAEGLQRELSSPPWGLSTVEFEGQQGWWKRDILAAIRTYLGAPASPQPSPSEDTVRLLDALAKSPQIPEDGEYLKSAIVLRVAADELDWPANTDGSRRVAAALRDIQIEAERPSGGDRSMSYRLGELRVAMARWAS
jgi:hypothetical protein